MTYVFLSHATADVRTAWRGTWEMPQSGSHFPATTFLWTGKHGFAWGQNASETYRRESKLWNYHQLGDLGWRSQFFWTKLLSSLGQWVYSAAKGEKDPPCCRLVMFIKKNKYMNSAHHRIVVLPGKTLVSQRDKNLSQIASAKKGRMYWLLKPDHWTDGLLRGHVQRGHHYSHTLCLHLAFLLVGVDWPHRFLLQKGFLLPSKWPGP